MRLRNHNPVIRAPLPGVSLLGGGRPVFFGLAVLSILFPLGCPSKPVRPDIAENGLIKPPFVMPREVNATPPEIATGALPSDYYLPLPAPKPTPPPVRRAPSTPGPEPEPPKHEAPQISPQLSPDELAHAKATAEDFMRVAQQNLGSANGKKLTVNQKDMVEKIRGFLKQAQDAIAISDWSSASSLAEKARLLSDELVKSLRP